MITSIDIHHGSNTTVLVVDIDSGLCDHNDLFLVATAIDSDY